MNKALPPIRHQVWLRVAPVAQRSGPLRRAADVVELQALDDDRAVHDAGHDRPDLAAGDRHHHLVEPADALRNLAHGDERLAVAEHTQCPKIGITEVSSELGGPQRQAHGGRGVVLERAEKPRNQHIAGRRAVAASLVQVPLGSCQPSARHGHLALQQQAQCEHARAASRSRPIARLQLRAVRFLPRLRTRAVLTYQIRGDRQPLEVIPGRRAPR